MIGSKDMILLVLAPTCSLALVVLTFFHRNRVYVAWAKIASIFAFITGCGWGVLGFFLLYWRSYHLSRDSYYTLVGLKGILGGIAIGFIFSILIARPYSKRHVETLPV
jgi:hypothetical protein